LLCCVVVTVGEQLIDHEPIRALEMLQNMPQSRDILRVVTPRFEDQQSESERGNGDGGESEQQLEASDHEEGKEPEPED